MQFVLSSAPVPAVGEAWALLLTDIERRRGCPANRVALRLMQWRVTVPKLLVCRYAVANLRARPHLVDLYYVA